MSDDTCKSMLYASLWHINERNRFSMTLGVPTSRAAQIGTMPLCLTVMACYGVAASY